MRLSAAALLLITALILAGCGGAQATPTPDESAPGATPAATPAPVLVPTATATAPGATPVDAGPTPTATPRPAPTPTPTATPALAPTATPSPTPTGHSVTLTPIADTTLYGESGDLGNGAGEHLFAGVTGRGNERRTLLRFDLSAIPASATLTRVRLTLTVDRTQAGPLGFGLHRVSTAWSEGVEDASGQEGRGAPNPSGATWTRASLSSTWGAPGGDFEAAASGSAIVDISGTQAVWEGAGLLADAQAWQGAPALNHGWLMRVSPADVPRTAKRFGSREGEPGQRPTLLVEYTLP
jgi:hypothetical protein